MNVTVDVHELSNRSDLGEHVAQHVDDAPLLPAAMPAVQASFVEQVFELCCWCCTEARPEIQLYLDGN
jgi:hypothetical protein